MTAQTATLTDFLLARIAEDEAAALAASQGPWFVEMAGDYGNKHANLEIARWRGFVNVVGFGEDVQTAQHVARHDPARVLAECEAKRRIVDLHDRAHHQCVADDEDGPSTLWRTSTNACDTLRALALPYADHEEFQEAWRV